MTLYIIAHQSRYEGLLIGTGIDYIYFHTEVYIIDCTERPIYGMDHETQLMGVTLRLDSMWN